METQITESTNRAARLYRLACLLTGDRTRSLEVTVEAIDSSDGTDSFFLSWLQAWSQRLGIREELAASARRTASVRIEKFVAPPRELILDPDADDMCAQLDRALLAIDLFPRCALLLTVFEKMSLEDAAVLVDGERDLVRKAQIIGLRELTRNLARMQGWTYTAGRSCMGAGELQHA